MRNITAITLAASLALTACGKDSSGPDTGADIAGTYTLTTVNGSPLPFTTDEDATYKAEILASAITLRGDRTFSWSFTGRSTDNGTPTTDSETFTGTYTVNGSAIRLTDSEGYTDATVADGVITIVITGPVGTVNLRFVR